MGLPFKMTPTVFHVLLAMSDGDIHAYGIMKQIESQPGTSIRIGPGSLHYTLGKLLDAGLIEEGPTPDEPGSVHERRRYFRLTPEGRETLTREAAALADLVDLARARRVLPAK